MNKRKTKKAIKKYVTGRPLCSGELKALSSKYPSLDLTSRPYEHLANAIVVGKLAFEHMAQVIRDYAVPSLETLGAVMADCAEKIRASIPTTEEWACAISTLILGYSDWQLQIPLYRWGS